MTLEKQTYRMEVEGIGAFTCRRREMGDSLRILAEYSRLTEGDPSPSPILDATADMVATLRILIADAPEGFVLDTLDPFDAGNFARMRAVCAAIRQSETAAADTPVPPKAGDEGEQPVTDERYD